MTGRYLVADCPRCGTALIADTRFKSKTCPKCNSRIRIEDLKIIQIARDSREARRVLSQSKAKRGGLNQR